MSSLTQSTHPIHGVFAAHEMTPNLSPMLDKRLEVQEVWVFYTENMLPNAQRLETVYLNHGLRCKLCEVSTAFDALVLVDELSAHCEGLDMAQMAFNISCGTKIYAVATVMAFGHSDAAIYYVLPNDELAWLQPRGREGFNLSDTIKLDEFLMAHDVSMFTFTQYSEHETLFANLVIDFLAVKFIAMQRYRDLHDFSRLYHQKSLIQFSLTKQGYQLVEKPELQGDLLVSFLQQLAKKNLITLNVSTHLVVMREPAPNWQRLIIGGGWFEYWVYRTIKKLQQDITEIQDVAFGAKIHHENAMDEIDVMFLLNNQLVIIECKTGGSANVNHHIHRINSLRKSLGGVLSHAAYITTERLDKNSKFRTKAAQLQGLAIFDSHDLMKLEDNLRKWVLGKLSSEV